MVPKWALEAEASKEVAEPAGAAVAVNEATGAWSGGDRNAERCVPHGNRVPAVLVRVSIGLTVSAPALDT